MSPSAWFRLLGLSCLLVAAASAVPALTQGERQGKRYALLVGVTEYDSKNFSPLSFPANDAEGMGKALKDAGFASVRVLTSRRGEKDRKDAPTAANIRAALKELLAKKTRHDTVLVGLAGHGIQLDVTDPKEKGEAKAYSYFCPQDASFQGISYSTGRSDQLLLLDELFDDLGKCDAGHKLALIDACRNNSKVQAARRRIDISRATIPDGVGVLFSCGRGQFAFETPKLGGGHGVFFYHVIQGLKGEAKNRKGLVTWDGLAGYVKSEVPDYVKENIEGGARQVPASLGNLEGESVLARVEAAPKDKDGGAAVVEKDSGKADKGKELVVKGPFDRGGKNSIGMKFVLVKKGKFTMGSPGDEDKRDGNETQHEVEITRDFYLGVYEVTQGQFREVMGFNPSHFSRDGTAAKTGKYQFRGEPGGGKAKVQHFTQKELDDFPVENVSWEDAREFLTKLNARAAEKKARVRYRLPTEAEWEYACRAGPSSSTKPFHFRKPSDSLGAGQANFTASYPYGRGEKGADSVRPNTVGKNGEPNALGIYDMHGNVSEWCSDWHDEKYYANSPRKDPPGPEDGSVRVIRGGGWLSLGLSCRAANRYLGKPDYRNWTVGFRVAAVPHE